MSKDLETKEKQDKILQILKEKKININYISYSSYNEDYNDRIRNRFLNYDDMLLEEDEFETIKEWLDDK